MLGLSFKLYNRFCFPWIWLFYLLEEISMSKNLSNSSDIIEILIAFLFLGLIEVLCLNLSVTKDCLSFLECHISWSFFQYSSNYVFYILGRVVLCRFKLQTSRQQWNFKRFLLGIFIIFLLTNLTSIFTPFCEAILLYTKTLSSFSQFERFCVLLSLLFFLSSVADIP